MILGVTAHPGCISQGEHRVVLPTQGRFELRRAGRKPNDGRTIWRSWLNGLAESSRNPDGHLRMWKQPFAVVCDR